MGWIATIFVSQPARRLLTVILAAFTIALFLLNLRRAGERAGRLAERLSTLDNTHEIQRQMLDAAAPLIAMLWLSACATGGSETLPPCPPVVEYSPADQARAAVEIEALPEGAMLVRMITDYAVMREQARACL